MMFTEPNPNLEATGPGPGQWIYPNQEATGPGLGTGPQSFGPGSTYFPGTPKFAEN